MLHMCIITLTVLLKMKQAVWGMVNCGLMNKAIILCDTLPEPH